MDSFLNMAQSLIMDFKFNMIAWKVGQSQLTWLWMKMILTPNLPLKYVPVWTSETEQVQRHNTWERVWSLKIFMVGDRLCLLFYALET